MIEVVKAKTLEQKREIVARMRGFGDENAEHVYGLYCDGNCIGGAAIVSDGVCNNTYHLGFNAKPSIALGKALAIIMNDMLYNYTQISTTVALSNAASRKIARQLGFRLMFENDGTEHLILDRTTWRYEKRWGV